MSAHASWRQRLAARSPSFRAPAYAAVLVHSASSAELLRRPCVSSCHAFDTYRTEDSHPSTRHPSDDALSRFRVLVGASNAAALANMRVVRTPIFKSEANYIVMSRAIKASAQMRFLQRRENDS